MPDNFVYEVFEDSDLSQSRGLFSTYEAAAKAIAKLVIKQSRCGLKPTIFKFEIVKHELNKLVS